MINQFKLFYSFSTVIIDKSTLRNNDFFFSEISKKKINNKCDINKS